MKHTFLSIALVAGVKENEGFSSWLVSLVNDKGLPVTIDEGRESFYLAEGYIDAAFKTKGIKVEHLETGDKYKALKNATFNCELVYKTKGEPFTALVAEGLVNTGTEAKPKWTVPVVGEDYIYQETGIMPNWSKANSLVFTDKDFDILIATAKVNAMDKLIFDAKMAKINAED